MSGLGGAGRLCAAAIACRGNRHGAFSAAAPPSGSRYGPPSARPPVRRRAASGGTAHELSGVERAGGRGPADADAEGPGTHDLQRAGGEAAGRKLDGGQVEDGKQTSFSDVAAEEMQKERSAAGDGVGPENCQESMEQVLQGDADGQAAGGRGQEGSST